ncbi:micronuclear linker histone polyprotein-like [Oscarella lobularis]|uniref:micronuclear linker histone polyprotein-like n=1 Tax=Oscarella lobularis TaxID=121494 RepID=UPI003313985B
MEGDGLKKGSSTIVASKKNASAPKTSKPSGENKHGNQKRKPPPPATSTPSADAKNLGRSSRDSPVSGRRSPKPSSRRSKGNGKTSAVTSTSANEKKSQQSKRATTTTTTDNEAVEEPKSSSFRMSYTSEELLKLGDSDLAKVKPSYLDPKFEVTGVWNLDAWMQSLSVNSDASPETDTFKSFSESVSLAPRSVGTGFTCSKTSDKKPESSTLTMEFRPRNDQGKGWRSSSKDDWRRGNKDGKKSRDGKFKILGEESYGGREEEEEEPEWMTFAPTSQMEFIELKGFDDDEDRHKHDAEAGEKDEDDGAALNERSATGKTDFNLDDFFKSDGGQNFTADKAPAPPPPSEEARFSRFTQWFGGRDEESAVASNQPAKDATTSEPRNGSSMPLLLQHLMQSAQNEKSPQVGEAPKKNVMDVENVEKMLQERHADPRREQDDVAKEKEKTSPAPKVPAAFLPTSVIKKMHHEGNLQPGILADKPKSPVSSERTQYPSLDDRQRAFIESQRKQQEILLQQHRAREDLLYQRQLLHEQQMSRQREMQHRALMEAEYRRRQSVVLALRKFAIDHGLPPDLDPRVLYQYYQRFQQQRLQQHLQQQQQQQQRNISPNPAAAAALAQHLARAGVRNTNIAASYQGVFPGVTSPGRNSPVSFTGTPPPSLRPIPKHPLQGQDGIVTAGQAGGLSKWFGGGRSESSPPSSSAQEPVEDKQSID